MKKIFSYAFCAVCVFVEFVEVKVTNTHYNLKLWKRYFKGDSINWERTAIFQGFDNVRRAYFGN